MDRKTIRHREEAFCFLFFVRVVSTMRDDDGWTDVQPLLGCYNNMIYKCIILFTISKLGVILGLNRNAFSVLLCVLIWSIIIITR